jgi:hypothetical protein
MTKEVRVKPGKLLLTVALTTSLAPAISAQPRKCGETTIRPIRVSRTAPLAVSSVEDPRGDFILDHPMFESNFRVSFESAAAIPSALDIIRVDVQRRDPDYIFRISTAGPNLPALLGERTRSVQFGVFVDVDRNGSGDVLLLTTDRPLTSVVLTPQLRVLERERRATVEGNTVTLAVARSRIGDRFDWVAFSGFSPRSDAHYRTPLDSIGVFFLPEIDLAYPDLERRMILFHHSISGSGSNCQITGVGMNYCPPQGNPPGRQSAPKSNCQGWMYQGTRCGNQGFEWWCNCSSGGPPTWSGGYYGKWVFNGSVTGWIAKCPYGGGVNSQDDQDTDQDGVADVIMHTTVDGGGDDDGDGYQDVMEHTFLFSSNQVTSCNKERNYQTLALINKRCCPARPPYDNFPSGVPSGIPPCPP